MSVQGTAEMSRDIARANVDQKVIELWLMLRDLHETDPDAVNKDDASLWQEVSVHSAIHRKLSRYAI